MSYTSPSEGQLSFSSDGPLTVDGKPQALGGYPRMDNPWVNHPFDTPTMTVTDGPAVLTLDTKAWTRTVAGPR